jgi:hypothetical protein
MAEVVERGSTRSPLAAGADRKRLVVRGVAGHGKRAGDYADSAQCPEPPNGNAQSLHLDGEGDVLKSRLSVKNALAGGGADVGNVDQQVDPVSKTVVADIGIGASRNRADIAIDSIEGPFPVVVPGVVGGKDAGAVLLFREHDAVVYGLCAHAPREKEQCRERQSEL